MKKPFLFFAVLLCVTPTFAIDTITVISKIKDVTVYLEGAQINREKQVSIPIGKSILKFSGLTERITANSIRIKTPEHVLVQSIQFEIDKRDKSLSDSKIKELNKQREQLKENIDYNNMQVKILEEQKAFYVANTQIVTADRLPNLEQIKGISSFIQNGLADNISKSNQLQKQVSANYEKIAEINDKIRLIQQRLNIGEKGCVLVKVKAKGSSNSNIKLSYMIPDAGWTPNYEVRVKNLSSPMEFISKANVFQKSGNNWNNVELTFTTKTPKRGVSIPKLETEYLHYNNRSRSFGSSDIFRVKVFDKETGEPLPGATIVEKTGDNHFLSGTVTDFNGKAQLELENDNNEVGISFIGYETATVSGDYNGNIYLSPSSMQIQEIVVSSKGIGEQLQGNVAGVSVRKSNKKRSNPTSVSKLDMPTVSKNHSETTREVSTSIMVNYEVKDKITIPSTPKIKTVELASFEINADYQHICAPKFDPNAYLIASFTDYSKLNLISGNATLFYENTYIGQTYLFTPEVNDTMQISLGVDESVSVIRKLTSGKTKTQTIGNKKTTTRKWEMVVRNNKSEPITLLLQDQFPIAQTEDIVVDLHETSKGKMNTETGEVSWLLELPPNKDKSVKLEYSVIQNKNRKLYIE